MDLADAGGQRVVEALPDSRVRTGKAYWLAYPERRRDLPALQAFRAWLLRESRAAGGADAPPA